MPEIKLSHPIIRVKRYIEQLKYYQLKENTMPAHVSFQNANLYYSIQYNVGKYILSHNFEGGCSQSITSERNLDLSCLFDRIEKFDVIQDPEFHEPAYLYSYTDHLLGLIPVEKEYKKDKYGRINY